MLRYSRRHKQLTGGSLHTNSKLTSGPRSVTTRRPKAKVVYRLWWVMQPQSRQVLVVLVEAIAAVIGGYVALLLFGSAASNKLAALSEVRRQELTEQDSENLKRIATAVEEYSVDHAGQYPRFLDDLSAQYLSQMIFIPGSNPAKQYFYVRYPENHTLGAYVIEDDGSFDPSLEKLHSGVSGSLCNAW